MPESALGFLLRSLREDRGLSLREAAQLAAIDHAYLYRLETGVKEAPSDDVLNRLIRALKAPKREAEMLRFLAAHPQTDVALVEHVRKETNVTFEEFSAVAGAAFRGKARPDYPRLIKLARQLFSEGDGRG